MEESTLVLLWWGGLCTIAFINILIWLYARKVLFSKIPTLTPDIIKWRKWHLLLAGLYTFGCGFRSILPRGDLRRIVMVDSWVSSVVIGRTVATIAELSFVAQWSFLLWEAGKSTGNKTIQFLAKIPFPMIVVAEIFSWYACTTSNYIGTVFEESLWAIAASITVYGLYIARPYYENEQRTFLNRGIIAGIGYVIYMVFVDVPAYVNNWLAAEESGKVYKSVYEGFIEVSTQWHLTRDFSDWEYEMIWMSLYFSVCVWMSIYLINAPKLNVLKK